MFAGIFINKLFLVVVVIAFATQFFIVQYGDRATKTMPMDMNQNLICIAFGFGEMIWGIIIKFFPLKIFQFYKFDETPKEEEEEPK